MVREEVGLGGDLQSLSHWTRCRPLASERDGSRCEVGQHRGGGGLPDVKKAQLWPGGPPRRSLGGTQLRRPKKRSEGVSTNAGNL